MDVDRDDHVFTLYPPGQLSGTVVRAVDGQPVPRFTVRLDFPKIGNALETHAWGVVVTEADNGAPLEGVKVYVVPAYLGSRYVYPDSFENHEHAQPGLHILETNADGAARLEETFTRKGTAMFRKDGYGITLLDPVDFTQPLTVALPRAGVLQGVLPEDPNRPDGMKGVGINLGVDVVREEKRLAFDYIQPDADGHFRFDNLAPGNYIVSELRPAEPVEGIIPAPHPVRRAKVAVVAGGQSTVENWESVAPK